MDIPMDEVLAQAKVWILSDGKAGHQNQSIGVAEAMGIENYEIISVERGLFGGVLKYIHPALALKFLPRDGFPDIAIGTGSLASAALQLIKMQNPQTFSIQMMKPFGKKKLFDVIAVPKHDNMKSAPNVVETMGAPNRITVEKLAETYIDWDDRLSQMAEKNVAIMVGGPIGKVPYSEEALLEEIERLVDTVHELGWGVMCSVSRRTSRFVSDEIEGMLNDKKGLSYFYDPLKGEHQNPYFAFLSRASAVAVTAESSSMLSEAATAGGPVLALCASCARGKFKALLNNLEETGFVFPFDEIRNATHLEERLRGFMSHPLEDTAKVAGFAQARFLQHWQKFHRL